MAAQSSQPSNAKIMTLSKAKFLNRFPKAICIKQLMRGYPEEFVWFHIDDGGNGVRGLGKTEAEAWRDAVEDIERQEGKKLELPTSKP